MDKKKDKPKIKVELKFPEDLITFAPSGFFGGLSEAEGIIKLFEDDLIPKLSDNNDFVLNVLEKKFLANLKLTPMAWKRLAYWMMKHTLEYEKKFGEIKITDFKAKIKKNESNKSSVSYEFV